jgi:hypothetical protein
MRRSILCGLWAVCAWSWFVPLMSLAGDTPAERATLKGLRAVRVAIECGADSASATGVKPADLEAQIASRLRAADIELLSADERAQGQPTLCLTLVAFADDSGGERMVSYWCELSLLQETRLVRAPAVHITAPTWRSPGAVASMPAAELHKLHDTIRRDVDLFVAAHGAANAP